MASAILKYEPIIFALDAFEITLKACESSADNHKAIAQHLDNKLICILASHKKINTTCNRKQLAWLSTNTAYVHISVWTNFILLLLL